MTDPYQPGDVVTYTANSNGRGRATHTAEVIECYRCPLTGRRMVRLTTGDGSGRRFTKRLDLLRLQEVHDGVE